MSGFCVQTGLDLFIRETGPFRGRRIALIANQTSVTGDLRYSWDVLQAAGLDMRRIFSPEHGLFSTEQDQVPVGDQPRPFPEVVSLYGSGYDSLSPGEGSLDDLDLVLFDIQDVGARYYTYLNTLILFMQAAAGRDLEIMVLDRPNPLGGQSVEGPLLRAGYESFVGLLPVPVRHGLTAGETALLAKDVLKLDISLRVLPMKGWRREMYFDDTGLLWVPPSPNMPNLETALVYPGFCLIEGTSLSEGRGTTTPFQLTGAPFICPGELAAELNRLDLPGVYFRPVHFKPSFHKFSGLVAGGIFTHVTDRTAFRSFHSGVKVVETVKRIYGDSMRFLRDVYEFNTDHPAFDLLAGSGDIREAIEGGQSPGISPSLWEREERDFREFREKFLLYK